MVWVATSSGVYKSTNAGTSWTKTLNGNIKDIKIKPTDPSVVYAVSRLPFIVRQILVQLLQPLLLDYPQHLADW